MRWITMDKQEFFFNTTTSIENRNFKEAIEIFYRIGIKGSVKENIQNALDARLDMKRPVKVIIKIGKIGVDFLPGYKTIKKRIKCLEVANQYTQEIVDNMQKAITRDEVNYITFEDQNTKGLEYIQGDNAKCSYNAYAYQQGNHYSDVNDEAEALRGGSHGIGKIASNSVSDIHLMYFANCDDENNKHLGGTICLVEHKYNGQFYRDMGYFTESIYHPYINDTNLDLFKKETRGLKIIIPFLRDEYTDEDKIIKSIISDYFLAIYNNDLIVEVNNKIINNNNLPSYLGNSKYFEQDFQKLSDEDFSLLNYYTYMNQEPFEINVNENKKDYKFKCYFTYDERIYRGRISFIRRIGMKICDRKISGYVFKPYNAVIIPVNNDSDTFLKSLENQSHNELSIDSIRDVNYKKRAQKIIKQIEQNVKNKYDEIHNINHPSEGMIDTSDLLYTFDKNFKTVVSKKISSLYIDAGKGKSQVVKINFGKKTKQNNTEGKKSNQTARKVKRAKRSGEGKELSSSKIIVYPDHIYRVISEDREYLECDLSDIENIESINRCNLVVRVVDGEGKDIYQRATLETNYKEIVDNNTLKNLRITGNVIRNIKIKNGKISLSFYRNDKLSNLLKNIYYVEV